MSRETGSGKGKPMKKITGQLASMLVTAILVSPLVVEAEIYRWVDEKGVTHYGDQPKIGAEAVAVRNGKPKSAPQAAQQQAPAVEDEAAREEKLAAVRKDQCDKAQRRYRQFSSSSRIVETDEFGKKKELSPEERLTTIAKAKGDVEAYCGNAPAATE